MRRHRASPRSDRRYFRITADKVREVNIRPNVSRGGIRF